MAGMRRSTARSFNDTHETTHNTGRNSVCIDRIGHWPQSRNAFTPETRVNEAECRSSGYGPRKNHQHLVAAMPHWAGTSRMLYSSHCPASSTDVHFTFTGEAPGSLSTLRSEPCVVVAAGAADGRGARNT